MERSFSVDDLVGGLYRLGQAGMGRTDSEAAFQEFLKRIPSATNLAAGGAGGAAAAGGLGDGPSGLGLSASASFAAISDAGLGGSVPRVPSLDLLAKLVMQGASSAPQTSAAPLPAASIGMKSETLPAVEVPLTSLAPPIPSLDVTPPAVDPAALQAAAALQAVPALAVAAAANPLALAALSPVAASLQLGSLTPGAGGGGASGRSRGAGRSGARGSGARGGGSGGGGGGGATTSSDGGGRGRLMSGDLSGEDIMPEDLTGLDKNEIRRLRRMQSNRESARRSRKRKQEHLQTLQEQLEDVAARAMEYQTRFEAEQRRVAGLEQTVAELQRELDALRGGGGGGAVGAGQEAVNGSGGAAPAAKRQRKQQQPASALAGDGLDARGDDKGHTAKTPRGRASANGRRHSSDGEAAE